MNSIRQNIFIQWVFWQFFEIPGEIIKAWKNYLSFNFYYFSTPLLVKTLFNPWRRYKFSYGKNFDLGKYLEALSSNFIFRIIGAFMRSILIVLSLLSEAFIILAGLVVFLGWLVLPFLLLSILIVGLLIIF